MWQLAVATPANLVLVSFSFLKTHSCVRIDRPGQEDEVQMGRTIRSFKDDCFGLRTKLAISLGLYSSKRKPRLKADAVPTILVQ